MELKDNRKEKIKVLCLEDEPRDVEIMRESLIAAGYDVSMDISATEKDFVSFLHSNTYDIILSDFKLPGFDGFTALRWAMEICPTVPFICVSGTIGEESAVELLKLGAVDFVMKDKLARLPAAIKRALDEAKEKELRQRAETLVRESELKLRTVADFTYDWEYWEKENQEIAYISPSCERITGYSPQEFMADPALFGKIVHPEDVDLAKKSRERVFTIEHKHDVDKLEFRIIHKNGSVVHLYHVCRPIFDVSDQYHGKRISNRDITERKQAEAALRESEVRFRELFNRMSSGVAIYEVRDNGEDFIFVDFNKAGEMLDGDSREDLIGKSIYEARPGIKEYGLLDVFKRVWKTGTAEYFPPKLYQDARLNKWYENFVYRLPTGEIVALYNDVTERKQAEVKLLKSEQKYRSIFENVQDVYYETSFDGTILEVSPSIEFISKGQYRRVDLIGRSMYEFYAETKNRDAIISAMQKAGSVADFEARLKNRDGSIISCSISAKINLDAEGRPEKIIGSMHDITERKRVEEELRENEEKYRMLFEETPVGIAISTIEGKIVELNKAQAEIIGGTVEELKGRNVNEYYISPDKRREMIELFKKTGKVRDFEMGLRKKDGSIVVELINLEQVKIGGKDYLFATGRDITERKRAEELLRESKVLIDAVVENVPLMIFLKEAKDLRFIVFNHAGEELLGYDRKALLGKNNLDLFPPEQAAHFMAKDREVLDGETGMLDIPEEPIQTAKKGQRLLHTRKVCIRGIDGITKYLLGISEDITDRKQAEEALQESELRFRSLYENTTIGLYRTTPDGKILLANPALVKMLGHKSFQDLAERNLEKDGFESSSHRKEFIEKIERDGDVIGHESKWIRHDGTAIFVMESARAIRDSQGKTLYYDGTVEDFTERRQMEEGLRQMQKLEGLGTLAGGIAHDFNNILGIILAYITSTRRFKDDAKKLDIAVDTIVKAVERGKTLVQQILTFARKTETTFEAVNVNDIVMEIVNMIYEMFPKSVTCLENIDKEIPCINADRSQLHQVFINLCVNARDAMPSGGVITINTRLVPAANLRNEHPAADASNYVCIEVIDTGEGMTPETQKRIFEPFFTTKELGKGTGLGLSVVFGIVQSHNGFIDIESELGKGTTFRIYLPESQMIEPINEKVEKTLEEMPGGTETLLIVEDEEMLLMPLQMVLIEKGYKVLSAEDGLTALKIYQERKDDIALVLTDLGLPNMTGLEVSQRIKKVNPNERIILATGFLDPEMKSEFLEAGIQQFLYKPYDLKIVLKVIREVLDKK